MPDNLLTRINTTRDFLLPRLQARQPEVGIILGSGLGVLADDISEAVAIPYSEIPGFAASSVHGHASRMVVGSLAGKTVLALQGRFHYYEGHDMAQVTLPVRVMKALGISTLIVTNAAGGLNQNFKVGDLVGIEDHIFLPGMVGNNPLRGENFEELGPRFPGMVNAYDEELLKLAHSHAAELGIRFQRGTYIMLSGPNFETRAEMRLLRNLGADVVGMSTVPEVVVAVHGGMRVLGISTVTNALDPDTTAEANHAEVLEVGAQAGPNLARLVKSMLPHI